MEMVRVNIYKKKSEKMSFYTTLFILNILIV